MAEYDYDANGNCKITAYNSDGSKVSSPAATHICNLNPFRWKAYYFDSESGLYYVNGRYYNPELGKFMDADNPENLLAVAFMLNSLDRNGVTVDNLVNVVACMWNIFTATELAFDPADPNAKKTWWDVHWKQVVGWILFVVTVLLSIVTLGVAGTIGVAVVSGLIGGAVANARGNDYWEGVVEGMNWGLNIAMIIVSVATIVKGIIDAVGAVLANAAREDMSLAAEDSTVLFRAVSVGERQSIAQSGRFLSEGYAEGKYFATTQANAETWGLRMYNGEPFHIIGTRVLTKPLQDAVRSGSAYFWDTLDTIGPAYYIEIDVIDKIAKNIWLII